MFKILCGMFCAAGLAADALAAPAPQDSDCLECHADKSLVKTNAAGKAVSLFVDATKLLASVHKTNSCASCHSDLKKSHPDDNVAAKP